MALLAIDIGGTSIKHALWKEDRLGEVSQVATPATWEEFLQNVKEIKTSYKDSNLTGVAISSPGAVDSEKGVIGGISAIPYLHNFEIVKALEEALELKVTIENDANCAALAEVHYGAARDYSDSLFLILGTGIGGAVVIDRKLHKGRNLFAGEFGCMLLTRDSYNFSQLGSTINMVAAYNEKTGKNLDGLEVYELYDQGDELAVEVVNSFYDMLARGIYNLLVTFDPEIVLLGGGVSQRKTLAAELTPKVQKLLEEQGYPDFAFTIEHCQFKNEANLVGAVANYNFVK